MMIFNNTRLIGAVASILAILILSISFVFTSMDREVLAETTAVETTSNVQTVAVEEEPATRAITEDVLWLARVIYSETKRPDEQELVAWVVRNRVETQFYGVKTYEEAVLAPWQFSAFNRNSPKRRHYTGLNEASKADGWEKALEIAHDVAHADASERPFAQTTRHFYSERSMVGRSHPAWAAGQRPVALDRPIDERRFRFFANIA
jgi:hypothetical protein